VPATMSNPRDAYLVLLGEMLFVERILSFEVIPETLKRIERPELSGALVEQDQQVKEHVRVIEDAFRALAAEPSSNHSIPFVALKEQHAQLRESAVSPRLELLMDASAAITLEHYKLGAYRVLHGLARAISPDAADPLEQNLRGEERTLELVEEALARLLARVGEVAPSSSDDGRG
jgi:ferritin-like metal-binding protein YciE